MDINWSKVLSDLNGTLTQVTAIETVRDWSQSRVLRLTCEENGGRFVAYAKLAHAGLSKEKAIYNLAARVDYFPTPLAKSAVIKGDTWLIMKEAAGTRLARSEPESYLRAGQSLAHFHVQGAREGWASIAGLTDSLSARFEHILPHCFGLIDREIGEGVLSGVDGHLLHFVRNHAEWKTLYRRIQSYPLTLIHGDCHSGNMFIGDDLGLQMIDWGSADLAPGLLDLAALVDVGDRMRENLGDVRQVVLAYWHSLDSATRQSYGDIDRAFSDMRCVRSVLELMWFTSTSEDYGLRVNRELEILYTHMTK